MRIHLLALLLAADPGPTIRLRDEGGPAKAVREINCVGPGVTCSASSTFGVIFVDAGSGAPTNASYITEVPEAGLSSEFAMSTLATGLVKNTTGTGVPSIYAGSTCGAGQFASATSASGALTCGTPAGVPGGSSPQVQYNSVGAFGGIANVQSDGTHLVLVAETTQPSSPSSDVSPYVFNFAASFPQLPLMRGSYLKVPLPIGFFSDFSAFGTDARWEVTCARPSGYGSTGTSVTNVAGGSAIATAGNSTGPAWATTSLYTRSRVLLQTAASTAASLNVGVLLGTGLQGAWRGDATGKGGFVYWTRVNINTGAAGANQQRAFFGLINRSSVLTANVDPSSFSDTVYFGADSAGGGAPNLSICSNDNSGAATCSGLGSSYPATTSGAFYDMWLTAAPGASTIEWAIIRLDSAASTNGSLSSDLPRNSVQFTWQDLINTGSSGGVAVALGWLGSCLAYGY